VHLHFLVTEGGVDETGVFHKIPRIDDSRLAAIFARVTSHIPDKGQVTVRYYGLYANAHRGKVKKASLAAAPLRIVEEELRRLPAKGWAAMIRKVYEVDPGKWSNLVWPRFRMTRPIIRPPAAGSAQFRDIDIRERPEHPPCRDGKG
jgi:hypothetical protein